MTRIEASWTVREENNGMFELPQEPDDIGWHEVFAVLQAAQPFYDIDESSIEWEVIDDAAD